MWATQLTNENHPGINASESVSIFVKGHGKVFIQDKQGPCRGLCSGQRGGAPRAAVSILCHHLPVPTDFPGPPPVPANTEAGAHGGLRALGSACCELCCMHGPNYNFPSALSFLPRSHRATAGISLPSALTVLSLLVLKLIFVILTQRPKI